MNLRRFTNRSLENCCTNCSKFGLLDNLTRARTTNNVEIKNRISIMIILIVFFNLALSGFLESRRAKHCCINQHSMQMQIFHENAAVLAKRRFIPDKLFGFPKMIIYFLGFPESSFSHHNNQLVGNERVQFIH